MLVGTVGEANGKVNDNRREDDVKPRAEAATAIGSLHSVAKVCTRYARNSLQSTHHILHKPARVP